MKQLPLFSDNTSYYSVVNVASVPHRSPFRYPGGKTWLIPYIRRWLGNPKNKPSQMIEPFAGGGIVGLTVAFENLADHVLFVELDEQVAAVWQTIIEDNEGEWLAERIVSFEFDIDTIQLFLSQTDLPIREKAFQTILKNRINRGGILANGAGRIKQGEAGKGIFSRWYPETLKKRILEISSIRERLSFISGDGLRILQQYQSRPDVVFFIDPPYTLHGKKAGSRLYTHSELNHEELFQIVNSLSGDFLITYDDNPRVRNLVQHYGLEMKLVPMKNTHHNKLYELLIGRDLSWLK